MTFSPIFHQSYPWSIQSNVAQLVKSNTIVLFGDSITSQNDYFGTSNWGFFSRANALMGQPFYVVNNAGISGNSTTQMLSRIYTDVVSYAPRWVHLLGGVNDPGLGVPTGAVGIVGSSIDNLNQILTILRLAGINVIVGTMLPNAGFSPATAASCWAINQFLQQYAQSTDGVILANYNRVLSDNSTIANTLINAPLTGVLFDGTHPSAYGGGLLAAELVRVLQGRIPMSNSRIQSNKLGAAGDQTQCIDNSMMLYGTGGSISGSNAAAKSTGLGSGEVGGAPQSWRVDNSTNTKVLSVSTVPRANCFNDGYPGSALRIDFTGGSVANEVFAISPLASAIPLVGHTYVVEMELYASLTSGTLDGFNPLVYMAGGSGFSDAPFSNASTPPGPSIWNGGQGNMGLITFKGALRSYPFTPAGTFSAFAPYTTVSTSLGAVGTVWVTGYAIRPWTTWVPSL